MKQTLIGMCCLILSLVLVACGSDFANSSTSFYSNYTAMEKNDNYEISGKCLVVNTLNIVYISSFEDNTVDLSGELKGISDDVKIVYINSDNKETVISDSNKNGKKGKLQLNTTISLEKGDSRIEFRGKKSTFKFNLSFFNIDKDKIEYFSAEKEEDELEEENFIDDEMESLDFEDKDNNKKDSDKLLDEITVSFTDKDDSSTILNTSLDKDTKIKVLVDAGVNNIDNKDNLSFSGFSLKYKTEEDNTIDVLKYKTNEFAMGGYRWKNSFTQEIDLPKGTSELIFDSYGGKNYEINLNIQVFAVD
ncbi:hypothetical protein [Anaerotignum propionicum]|uniref:hypothetical protein n=1 Tax=Anaerotignum propionicum TaxID=28446 RepID=UPI00210C9BF1|nr:hypothetical protein [Anaerotignum propionicum]MCQ4935278.1 hypothetical protein [Anaerotignum propionicum]